MNDLVRRSRRPLVVALMISLGAMGLLVTGATPAAACSCAGATTYEELAADADVVLAGRAETTSRVAVVATVAVDRVFKGQAPPVVTIHTPGWSDACGFEVGQGEDVLVVARIDERSPRGTGDSPSLTSSLCGMVPMTGAYAIDATDLPDGYAPLGAEPTDGGGFPLLGWLSFGAVAGLGVMPVLLWVRLRGSLHRA